MTYDQRQESLRAEALRVVPGVMAAKARHDVVGAAKLMGDYNEVAISLGITAGVAWEILFSATLHWAMELADALAFNRDVQVPEVLTSLGYSALSWMSEERGVGGY
jgi:hypothetical protein